MPRRPKRPKKARAHPPASRSAPVPAPAPASSSDSPADLASLDAFCAAQSLDDISFDAWERSHVDLDLRMPCWVPAETARAGGVRELCYSRHIDGRREKRVEPLLVPQAAHDGQVLVLKGLGDIAHDRAGDLIVTLRVKN